jgi:hypothetical protein
MVDVKRFTSRLSNNAAIISSLIRDVSKTQARWKPDPQAWSILEVINHLYDEEREDFRQRLDLILHQPNRPWPPNDPAGWVIERQYNRRDLKVSLDNFLKERERSLAWLNDLTAPNWQNAYEHPSAGTISAGDMLAAWPAHDLLHLRQLVELQWAYQAQSVRPIALNYAGTW